MPAALALISARLQQNVDDRRKEKLLMALNCIASADAAAILYGNAERLYRFPELAAAV